MKRIVGIDIGNHSIKLIELEDKKGRLELAKAAFDVIAKGDVKSTLKNLLLETKLSSKFVNVSLSGPSVIVRYIEMPPMKIEELKSAIKFEAEKYIPFNIKDSIIDCAMLDKTSSGALRVLLVAARKKEVDDLLGLFKEFNLEVNAIDIDSFAFLNSFERLNLNSKKETTYALVNIGSKISSVNILTKGSVYFTRDMLWGGEGITKKIKDATGLSMEEAEALKRSPADRREEIVNIVTSVFERFISQIRMSFDYHESQFGKSVEKIYISGGSSYLFNIVDFLKDSLSIDVVMWNPFESIRLEQPIKEIQDTPSLFAVAVGLALRK